MGVVPWLVVIRSDCAQGDVSVCELINLREEHVPIRLNISLVEIFQKCVKKCASKLAFLKLRKALEFSFGKPEIHPKR